MTESLNNNENKAAEARPITFVFEFNGKKFQSYREPLSYVQLVKATTILVEQSFKAPLSNGQTLQLQCGKTHTTINS